MKKALLWLIAGLVLLIGGGALASLGVTILTIIGIVLAVAGVIIILVLSIISWLYSF
jgi:hypothetical protein